MTYSTHTIGYNVLEKNDGNYSLRLEGLGLFFTDFEDLAHHIMEDLLKGSGKCYKARITYQVEDSEERIIPHSDCNNRRGCMVLEGIVNYHNKLIDLKRMLDEDS